VSTTRNTTNKTKSTEGLQVAWVCRKATIAD